MTEEQSENADIAGCGRQLRRTREKLGLSVDDVAEELRLSGFQIQALEDDDWSQLPGTTYARGYLRSYARLLGLDADQLLTGASTQEIEISRKEPEIDVPKAPEPETGEDKAPEPEAGAAGAGGPARSRTWLLVAIVVVAVGYWQYREGGLPLPDLANGGGSAQHAGDGASAPAGEADEEADHGPVAAPEPAPGTTAAAEEFPDVDAPAMPTTPDKAVFQFNQRSWIEVRDASGERLLYRDYPAGRRVEVEGRPPFQIYLGNAPAVQVEYMGDVIDPDTGSERMYARFTLGASSG